MILSHRRSTPSAEKTSAKSCSRKEPWQIAKLSITLTVNERKPGPWIMYQVHHALLMKCIPYYEMKSSHFEYNCNMNASCENNCNASASSRMASILSLNSEASLHYIIHGVQPLANNITIQTSVKSSKSPSAIRHMLPCFISFIESLLGKVKLLPVLSDSILAKSSSEKELKLQFHVFKM